MHRKREVIESREAWVAAQRELDAAIGIELAGDDAPIPAQTMNIRRFRTAVTAERAARMRYARALHSDGKAIPEELLWDVEQDDPEVVGHRGSDDRDLR